MKCPYCGEDDDRVVDSRSMNDGLAIRRRRECLECQKRFTTYERAEEIELSIIKRDQRREPYERKKITDGIRKACQKRPVSEEKIQEIADCIERELHSDENKEVPSTRIGELIMEELRKTDQVAYVRFASVYRQFKDANQFMKELQGILEIEGKPGRQR
ncbi:MAG TPA: transcriptional regulator NrdR [bacterium]|nr:transcriptional regulator NrdR [bacterium]